jgi:rhamnulose-1-phosphate aldolase/alcohol dehydrogenase
VSVIESMQATALDHVVHFSRLLGADESLVLRGGGNTSVKTRSKDLAGRDIDVLLIKGSGSDLASARPADFAALRLADLLLLRGRADMSDEDMVEYLLRCKLDPAAPRPSIETLLHAFLPAVSVFHSHADAILALVNSTDPERLVGLALGQEIACVPYRRPGFRLSVEVGQAASRPGVSAVVLLNHGLVTWGDSPESAYRSHLELVGRASAYLRAQRRTIFTSEPKLQLSDQQRLEAAARVATVLRGALSEQRRVILVYDDDPAILDFVGSAAARSASAYGAATPDHILTTKNLPLWVDAQPATDDETVQQAVARALTVYRSEYRAYVARWRGSEPELDPDPRLILVPGIGLFTAGANLRAARLARDIYRHTIGIMASAESVGGYRSLPEAEAFRAEYWPLELFKLTLAPPEKELARRVALVTGAGSGLGRAIALKLASAGAHVVVSDLAAERAQATAQMIEQREKGAHCLPLPLDVTHEQAIDTAVQRTALAFGGIDVVVSNAGFAHCAPIEQLQLTDWERSFAVNATGHFLIARAALRHFRRQRLGGNIVFVATKNVVAPGADFAAYSAAKSAEAQLARVAAIEGGKLGVRVNMVNPDAIFGDTHLWDDIKQERARAHGVPPAEIEAFYRQRSLLGLEVRAEDVAEAVLFLASDRSSRTTGAMIPVDAGVREAFVR